jgi:hypothetical protein
MNDNEVVIWRPLPTPDGSRRHHDPNSAPQRTRRKWQPHDLDDEDLQRWRKLADISGLAEGEP